MIKKIEKGYSFALSNRIGGYLTQAFGLYILINNFFEILQFNLFSLLIFLTSTFFFLIGASLSYAFEYLIIDYKEKSVKNILSLLGFKTERKNNLNKYSNISVISRRYTYSDDYDDNVDSFYRTQNDHTYKHDLVFLTPKHLGRLLISQFNDYDEALDLGKTVAKHTGKPLVKYAPKRISRKDRR